jgi:predicted kinase
MHAPFCLVLCSGLPGCGKTTLARLLASHFGFPLFAKDRLQSALRRDGLAPRSGPEGYRLILDLADEQLALGTSAVLDGVFPLPGFRADAQRVASLRQAGFRPIYCHCSDEGLWQARMQGRVQYVPDWSPVGWSEVLRLRAEFQPWPPGAALCLDAVDPLDRNLAQALAWVQARPER